LLGAFEEDDSEACTSRGRGCARFEKLPSDTKGVPGGLFPPASLSAFFIVSTPKRKEFQYFATRLADLKKAGNLTQGAIAAVAGVSQPTVQAWLKATSGPSIGQLIALADYLHVPTVDELIRPTERAGETRVVPVRLLEDLLKGAREAARTLDEIVHQPATPGKAKRKRTRGA
jgi:transcriptional regulator with XRE-family HTH domain